MHVFLFFQECKVRGFHAGTALQRGKEETTLNFGLIRVTVNGGWTTKRLNIQERLLKLHERKSLTSTCTVTRQLFIYFAVPMRVEYLSATISSRRDMGFFRSVNVTTSAFLMAGLEYKNFMVPRLACYPWLFLCFTGLLLRGKYSAPCLEINISLHANTWWNSQALTTWMWINQAVHLKAVTRNCLQAVWESSSHFLPTRPTDVFTFPTFWKDRKKEDPETTFDVILPPANLNKRWCSEGRERDHLN